MLRNLIVAIVVISFIALGVIDLSSGQWKTGSASLLLAMVNVLFLA